MTSGIAAVTTIAFNVAKANPRRMDSIISQVIDAVRAPGAKNSPFICLQECRRWNSHIGAMTNGRYFIFGSKISDCMILVPSEFMGFIQSVYSGPRHMGIRLRLNNYLVQITSAHFIWDVILHTGELEVVASMDAILTDTGGTTSPNTLNFFGIDANVSPPADAAPLDLSVGSGLLEDEGADVLVGKGVLKPNGSKRKRHVDFFCNLLVLMGTKLANTLTMTTRE